jgi:predicted RNase H-like HicB family nuclease
MEEHDMRSYTILIHRDADSQMYLVDVPDLPGVITEGETEADAVANASEAIRSHLALLQREGEVIPEPSYDARSVAVAV